MAHKGASGVEETLKKGTRSSQTNIIGGWFTILLA